MKELWQEILGVFRSMWMPHAISELRRYWKKYHEAPSEKAKSTYRVCLGLTVVQLLMQCLFYYVLGFTALHLLGW